MSVPSVFDVQEMSIGSVLSLKLEELAEQRTCDLVTQDHLGASMQGIPDMKAYQALVPYNPYLGMLFAEGERPSSFSPQLESFLDQVPAGHSFQIFAYPLIWVPDPASAISYIVSHRERKDTDPVLPWGEISQSFSQERLRALFRIVKGFLVEGNAQEILQSSIEELRPSEAGYLGNVLRLYYDITEDSYPFLVNEHFELTFPDFIGDQLKRNEDTPWGQFILGEWEYATEHHDRGRTLYKQSADQGYACAQERFAWLCLNEEEDNEDSESAQVYFQKAADQGHADAQFSLAHMYHKRENGEKNLALARRYYQLAADQGHADAQYYLADMYSQGEGSERNLEAGRRYLKLAVDQGCAAAQYKLAELYRDEEKNLKTALRYYQLAADQGYAEAQYALAYIYHVGENGEKDLALARRYYQLAANQGHAEAQYYLADMCAQGAGGTKNLRTSRHYYRLAAVQGHAEAQHNLAYMYYKGDGGSQNLGLAHRYLTLAAAQGYELSQRALTALDENRLQTTDSAAAAEPLPKQQKS
ncbi:MAG: hypothetical protein A2065_03875 [Alphaproteobacteria bacterium GWB1_45_5]|nr:MAG: hypothetical protein A2065_03875 [Alphaproteobacteria bacterium GWB1_45_5]